MAESVDIEDKREGWVAWINTDLTEGRGWQYPLAICEAKASAERLGRKQNVMGCDADYTVEPLFKIKGRWYGPIRLVPPSKEDDPVERRRIAREDAIKKGKKLGLSDSDIKDLIG